MSSEVLNILQISDTHLYADIKESLLGVTTQKSLEAVIQWIQKENKPVDFILHSGDISQDHSEASYLLAEKMLSVLKAPAEAGPHLTSMPDSS